MKQSDTLKALIVDDEALARRRLRLMLERDGNIEIIGECANGREAVSSIKRNLPDVVFLDVQMPGLDGFGALAQLDEANLPAVVFVTAFNQYALQAFEVSAVDYLLKPFDQERLSRAIAKVRGRLGARSDKPLHSLIKEIKRDKKYLDRVAIRNVGRIYFIKVAEVDWIESAHNYVGLHVGKATHLLRESMKSIESKLDPDKFVRIHRTTIVNVDRVKEISPWFHGDQIVILGDNTRLTLSRGRRKALKQLLGES